jgi:hypothetical protein
MCLKKSESPIWRGTKMGLANNNLHTHWEHAKRNFTAQCGCKVKKGELVLQFYDYFNGSKFHKSSCVACTQLKPMEVAAQ